MRWRGWRRKKNDPRDKGVWFSSDGPVTVIAHGGGGGGGTGQSGMGGAGGVAIVRKVGDNTYVAEATTTAHYDYLQHHDPDEDLCPYNHEPMECTCEYIKAARKDECIKASERVNRLGFDVWGMPSSVVRASVKRAILGDSDG